MYTVTVTNGLEMLVNKTYKTPWGAVNGWLKESKKHPFEAAIDATTKEEVIALRKMVKDYEEWFLEAHAKAENTYDARWLLGQVQEPEKLEGCEFKYDDVPSYPCIPFTVG